MADHVNPNPQQQEPTQAKPSYKDLKNFRKMKRLHNKINEEFLMKVEELYIKGKYDEALIELETLPDLKNNEEALCLLGHVQNKKNLKDQALKTFLQCDHNNSRVTHSIGILYFQEGKYTEAANYLSQAVNYNTGNINYRFHLALTYEKLAGEFSGDRENSSESGGAAEMDQQEMEYLNQSREEYVEILNIDPNNFNALMNLGVLEARTRNYSNAVKYLTSAKYINPNDYRVFLNLGNSHFIDQNFQSAVQCYKEALKSEPKNYKILKPYMISLSKLEHWEELEEICKLLLKIDKKNTQALALLSRALKENKKFKEAEELLNRVSKKIEDISKKRVTTQITKTIQKLKKKLKRKLKDIKAKNFSSDVKNESNLNKNISEATKELLDKKTSLIVSEFLTPTKRVSDCLNNDFCMKDPREYLEILKTDKMNNQALYSLGMIFFKNQEFALAEEYFLKLNQSDPNFLSFSVNEKIGDIHFKLHKNYEIALQYYEQSNQVKVNGVTFIKIGRCYEKLDQIEEAVAEYKKSIEVNPNLLWGIFHLGCAYSKLNKPEALTQLKRAYELDKENTDVIAKYGEELIKSDHVNEGIEILKLAMSHYSGNVEIMMGLAKGYEKTNQLTEAIKVLEEAYTYSEFYINPNRLFLLALYYERNKNFNKATQIYKNVLAINKEHLQSLVHLGFILYNAREFKRAHKYFKYALKIDPNLAYAHYGIGRIYQNMKNFDEAIDHFMQCAGNDKDHFKTYFQMGIIHLELNNQQKSKELFEKCLEINPDYIFGIVGLGNVYYELGDLEMAEKFHSRGYSLNKNDLQTIISFANTLSALGRYEDSIILYNEALKKDSEIADIHYSLGNAYYLIDHFDEAITHYIRCIKIEKEGKPEVYYNLGNALCARHRYKESTKCFKEAIKLDIKNSEAYYNLANAYYIMKNWKKAYLNYEECLKRNYMVREVKLSLVRTYFSIATPAGYIKCEEILKIVMAEEPNNPDYLLYHALIMEKTNMKNEAIGSYKKILEIQPDNQEVKASLESHGVYS